MRCLSRSSMVRCSPSLRARMKPRNRRLRSPALPAIYSGRLARRGETDYYSFRADAGQLVTFQVISGFPQIAAAGSAATVPNFDPAITVYEPAGSWFDPKRLNRIAYNDEPVWVFGKPTDALLVHRFARAGEYLAARRGVRRPGRAGLQLCSEDRAGRAGRGQQTAAGRGGWDERGWTRQLDAARLNQLAKRGGADHEPPAGRNLSRGARARRFQNPRHARRHAGPARRDSSRALPSGQARRHRDRDRNARRRPAVFQSDFPAAQRSGRGSRQQHFRRQGRMHAAP